MEYIRRCSINQSLSGAWHVFVVLDTKKETKNEVKDKLRCI